jgi:carbon-monoxide dehydrogenase large subunit
VDDPVACVIAETRAQARDAAEAVVVDVDPLPAVVEASAAAAPGAQLLFDRPGGTVVLDFH